MRVGRLAATASLVAALAFGVAACGDDDDDEGGGGGDSAGTTLNIYSSLPLQGAQRAQTTDMVNGIKLAVKEAGNKVGDFNIKYTSLDDSTAQAGSWEPGQVSQNARRVAQDENAIAYIGEFNSGASAISIPILNEAGVPQVSPANTYPGLTTDEPGTEKGEPDKYYPTGERTYARIVPRDLIQGAALVTIMKEDGCKAVFMTNDKEVYGAGLARVIEQTAEQQQLNIVSNDAIDKDAANYRALASKMKGENADCFIFSGITANNAPQLYKDVAAAVPNVKMYGPDGVAEDGFTNPKEGGVPANIADQITLTVATLGPEEFGPEGEKFFADFEAAYGDKNPNPYSIYGYEAMKLILDAIERAGENGNDKKAVLEALFNTKDRDSVLGTYSIDENGDTTLTTYGVYSIKDGTPTFERSIEAEL